MMPTVMAARDLLARQVEHMAEQAAERRAQDMDDPQRRVRRYSAIGCAIAGLASVSRCDGRCSKEALPHRDGVARADRMVDRHRRGDRPRR